MHHRRLLEEVDQRFLSEVECASKVAYCVAQRSGGGYSAYPGYKLSVLQLELGMVSQADLGDDRNVRKGRRALQEPKGRGYVTVQRPVNRLIVLVPAHKRGEETNPYL